MLFLINGNYYIIGKKYHNDIKEYLKQNKTSKFLSTKNYTFYVLTFNNVFLFNLNTIIISKLILKKHRIE